jgi:CDP-glucose 4,6-dehydratase
LLKLSIEKAKKVLQWIPKLNSKEAIQWTIDWYRQAPETLFSYTLEQIKKYQQK